MIHIALFVQLKSLLNNMYLSLNLIVREQARLTFKDIGVNVYSNSDVVVCIKCFKSLVKYQKAEKHGKEIKIKLKFAYSESGRRAQ